MKNLPEFKALIERYESVTIEEIQEKWGDDNDASFTAGLLTGYDSQSTCTLCKAVPKDNGGYALCKYCTWVSITENICFQGDNRITYEAIDEAKSPEHLLTAFRARAAYMRQVLKDGGIE